MDIATNRQVGEFLIHQQIGDGNSATVYRAYQPTVNRYVALKVINLPLQADAHDEAVFERRFVQEAQTLAALEHPHIVPIYHYGMIDATSAYIAMRLMHESLEAMLAEGPLSSQRVADITLQLIEGLSYAHRKGVLHQDIKPENILFDEVGSACLADFGLSRTTDRSIDITQPNFVLNTAVYVSPEQIRSSNTDPRSDIYSLGVVMYQMLTGRLPFEADNLSINDLLHKIEYESPIPPRKLNAQIAPEIERVVLQALRKEPRERFFDVGEMAQALEAVPGTRLGIQRPKVFLQSPKSAKPSITPHRRIRLMLAVVLIAAFFAFAILIEGILRQHSPPHPPTIMGNTHGSIADIVPSSGEMAQAQRLLGNNGFIAYIACDMNSQFQSVRAREMHDLSESDGLAYRVYDSANDDYKQLILIEQARLEGAKAIILCPLSPDVLSDSLTSVQSAHIPLVLTTALAKAYGGVMLSQDEHETGLLDGRFIGQTLLAQATSDARIVILDAPEYPFSDARVQGFLDGLAESLPHPQIVGRYPAGAGQAASQTAIAKLISAGQQIDAVFSVTDSGAYGTIAAFSSAHIPPDSVVIASVNAESAALDHISRNDYLRASVNIGLDTGSRGVFNAAVKLLGGGTLPQILTSPSGFLITRDIIVGQSPNK